MADANHTDTDTTHALGILGPDGELSDLVPAAEVTQAELDAVQEEVDDLEALVALDSTVQTLTPGAAVAFDVSLGRVGKLAMSTDATQTITITNLADGESCSVRATQNAAGSKALVFASTHFAGGTEPTQTAAASAVDIYTIFNVGGQLYGFVAGQDLKA